MLKYTTSSIGNEDGIASPGHHPEIDYSRRHIDVSAGSKTGSKMAIKKTRGGMRRILAKEQREIAFKNQVSITENTGNDLDKHTIVLGLLSIGYPIVGPV